MIIRFITTAFLLGMVAAVATAETSASVQDLTICKSPGRSASGSRTVRTLRVYGTTEKSESGESSEGCRATYSKTNVEQTVGTSRQVQQCQSILSGIQKNLEASKWSCRRVGAVAILKSNAAESNEALASPVGGAVKPVANSVVQ